MMQLMQQQQQHIAAGNQGKQQKPDLSRSLSNRSLKSLSSRKKSLGLTENSSSHFDDDDDDDDALFCRTSTALPPMLVVRTNSSRNLQRQQEQQPQQKQLSQPVRKISRSRSNRSLKSLKSLSSRKGNASEKHVKDLSCSEGEDSPLLVISTHGSDDNLKPRRRSEKQLAPLSQPKPRSEQSQARQQRKNSSSSKSQADRLSKSASGRQRLNGHEFLEPSEHSSSESKHDLRNLRNDNSENQDQALRPSQRRPSRKNSFYSKSQMGKLEKYKLQEDLPKESSSSQLQRSMSLRKLEGLPSRFNQGEEHLETTEKSLSSKIKPVPQSSPFRPKQQRKNSSSSKSQVDRLESSLHDLLEQSPNRRIKSTTLSSQSYHGRELSDRIVHRIDDNDPFVSNEPRGSEGMEERLSIGMLSAASSSMGSFSSVSTNGHESCQPGQHQQGGRGGAKAHIRVNSLPEELPAPSLPSTPKSAIRKSTSMSPTNDTTAVILQTPQRYQYQQPQQRNKLRVSPLSPAVRPPVASPQRRVPHSPQNLSKDNDRSKRQMLSPLTPGLTEFSAVGMKDKNTNGKKSSDDSTNSNQSDSVHSDRRYDGKLASTPLSPTPQSPAVSVAQFPKPTLTEFKARQLYHGGTPMAMVTALVGGPLGVAKPKQLPSRANDGNNSDFDSAAGTCNASHKVSFQSPGKDDNAEAASTYEIIADQERGNAGGSDCETICFSPCDDVFSFYTWAGGNKASNCTPLDSDQTNGQSEQVQKELTREKLRQHYLNNPLHKVLASK